MILKYQTFSLLSLLHKSNAERVASLLSDVVATGNRNLWEIDSEDDCSSNTHVDLRVSDTIWEIIETEAQRAVCNQKELTEMIGRELPHSRPFGSVHLTLGDDEIHLHFDREQFSNVLGQLRFGNYLSLRLNLSDAESALSRAKYLFRDDTFEYGYVCHPDHFAALNLDECEGIEAVGLDVSKFLPGFYWGNYFSKKLCEKIGFSPDAEIPGCHIVPLEYGVLIFNRIGPDRWREAEFVANADAAMTHIGKQLFFQKGVTPAYASTQLFSSNVQPAT